MGRLLDEREPHSVTYAERFFFVQFMQVCCVYTARYPEGFIPPAGACYTRAKGKPYEIRRYRLPRLKLRS